MFVKKFFGVPNVIVRERAGFDEVGDDGAGLAAEQAEEIVDQLPLGGVARYGGFKDEGGADFLGTVEGLLHFQAVHHRLHGGVGGTVAGREGFVNFADGAGAFSPQSFHDLEFELAEFGVLHRRELLMYAKLLQVWFYGKNYFEGGD
jgi:hypothetical protein